jgi:phosphomannomutase
MLPSTVLPPAVLAQAQEWIAHDPNESTACHVQELLEGTSETARRAVLEYFGHDRVAFGTAGLRARMQPGPRGLNDLVVIQTAQGMIRYYEEQYHEPGCVVIGYDHRATCSAPFISSLSMAIYTALVFTVAKWDCFLLHGYVPTPLVPYCIARHQKQQHTKGSNVKMLGIMITASHNPASDAGFKVYWHNGCQIKSPIDQGIARHIQLELTPWIDYRQRAHELLEGVADGVDQKQQLLSKLSNVPFTEQLKLDYLKAIGSSGLVVAGPKSTALSLPYPKFCYTAMHGVGYSMFSRVMQAFGIPSWVSVPQQQEPDPAFPTVAFPNPEEAGALTLAQEYARQHDCPIILANDPDADRLAVAEWQGNEWMVFTGDQLGVMLGHWLWQQETQRQAGGAPGKTMAMCASTVSSQMLQEIARVEQFHFEETLTGFKWIGSRAQELQAMGYQSLFCYEEAIGYCCGSIIFDKDGLTAAGVLAQLAVFLYVQCGRTLQQHLQSLYDKYGEFVSQNGYFILPDPGVVLKIMRRITNEGRFDTFHQVGGYQVQSFRYLGEPGYDSTTADHVPTLPTSASSPMITIRFQNGCVLQLRGSGTEPKLKYYMEMKGQPGISSEHVARELTVMRPIVLEELLQPAENGLLSSPAAALL